MALREFMLADLDPYRHFASLDFLGTHDAVVYAVLVGTADVGIVRTDTIERMETGGLIDARDVKAPAFSVPPVSTRSGPYEFYGIIRPIDILKQYAGWIAGLTLAAIGLMVLAGFLFRSNRELLRLQNILSTIVHKRTAELIKTSTHLTEKSLLLEMSRADKEALVREVNHRVKNNLQVIISLLNLQSGSIQDPNDRAVFQKLKMRIASMSLVHESLADSENAAAISMEEYTSAQVDGDVSFSYSDPENRKGTTVSVRMPIRSNIPLLSTTIGSIVIGYLVLM